MIEDVAELSTLLFAEFVDWALENSKLPSLAALSGEPGFADAFKAYISTEQFIANVLFTEMAAGNRYYSVALVFVCDYLYEGPGFIPWIGDAFQDSNSSHVLTEWSGVLLSMEDANPATIFDFACEAASLVSAPVTDKLELEISGGKATRSQVMNGFFRNAVAAVQKKGGAGISTKLPVGKTGSKALASVGAAISAKVKLSPAVLKLTVKDLDDLTDRGQETFVSIASTMLGIWDSTVSEHFSAAVAKLVLEVDQSQRKVKGSSLPSGIFLSPAIQLADVISGGKLSKEVRSCCF